ncbi:MAG: fibronectin type III domain-containing protein [Granulosicoccus sp.]|nr:fibronectin type III domain-containing protein [Granulosicoccus sp.]
MNTLTRNTLISAFAVALTVAASSTTAWARDKIPPTMPKNFTAQTINGQNIKLQWAESDDNFGVERYHLMRDGNVVTRTDQLSYIDSGLQAGSSYRYDVMADDGENYSFVSSIVVTIPVGSKAKTVAR